MWFVQPAGLPPEHEVPHEQYGSVVDEVVDVGVVVVVAVTVVVDVVSPGTVVVDVVDEVVVVINSPAQLYVQLVNPASRHSYVVSQVLFEPETFVPQVFFMSDSVLLQAVFPVRVLLTTLGSMYKP